MPPQPAIYEVPLATQLCYLAAPRCLSYFRSGGAGLARLQHPAVAVLVGEIGMIVAIVGTLAMPEIRTFQWIIVTLLVGTAVGIPLAMLMPMTAVPQRTALSHSFGGLAVGCVGAGRALPYTVPGGTGPPVRRYRRLPWGCWGWRCF